VSAGAAVRSRLERALAGAGGAEAVRWALRAPAPRALLRSELAALLPADQTIGPLRLRRAKFKPGKRLSAWYDVELGRAGTRPIAVTWVPRARWAGETRTEPDAMETEAAAAGLAAPFRRLRADSPELGLRMMVAPLDPAFPQLVGLSDPDRVPGLLAGRAGPEATWSVAAIRYRPGQRHVLRWTAADGRVVFAKLYRNGAGAQAFQLARRVAELLEEKDEPVAGASPLAYLPEQDVLLYPLIPGRPLSAVLGRGAAATDVQFRRAGKILRALHAAQPDPGDGLAPRGLGDDADEVHKAAGHIRFLTPDTGARLDELLDRARALHDRLPGEPPVLTHGDYKTDHLLATPDRLTVIDFDTCALADPALDLGKLLADIRWWAAAGRPVDLVRAGSHLLEGYGAADAERLLRARLYEVVVLAKLTVRRVRVADPDWARRTAELLNRCAELLDSLERDIDRGAVTL
jgi:aminoglycoside phosphotransferase (APT) family kinase protein